MLTTRKLFIAPGWERTLRENHLDSFDALVGTRAGTVVKGGANTEVRKLALANGTTLFLKQYAYPTRKLRWSGAYRGTFLGQSKARREFENLRRLRAWGLDAPAPVAYGELRVARWLHRSLLLSEAVPEATPLDVFIRDQLPPARRRELIDNLADYTRRLHERRFVHHDYFWRNILLSQQDLTHFFLIDSHKGHGWRFAAQHWRAKDLGTLDAPAPAFFRRTERLRFFLRYVGHRKLIGADKKLLRRTLAIAAPLRAAQLERVRKAKPHAS